MLKIITKKLETIQIEKSNSRVNEEESVTQREEYTYTTEEVHKPKK